MSNSSKIVASFEFGDGQFTFSPTILCDGRIYVAGTKGHWVVLQVPENTRGEVKLFAAKPYEESGAAPAATPKRASSNDEDVLHVSDSRKRGREEYEKGNESAQVTEIKLALKKELKKSKLEREVERRKLPN